MSTLAIRIRERRKQLSLSQEDLAVYIGTNQRQVSRYESGDNIPSADVLAKLARALDTTTDWLVGLSDIPERRVDSTHDLSESEKKAIYAWRRGDREAAAMIILADRKQATASVG